MSEPEVSKVPSGTEQPTQQPSPTEVATQQPSPTDAPAVDHTEMLVNHEDRIAELEAALKHPANLHLTEIIVNLQSELSALKLKLRHMI